MFKLIVVIASRELPKLPMFARINQNSFRFDSVASAWEALEMANNGRSMEV
jgi:hypothetical protein